MEDFLDILEEVWAWIIEVVYGFYDTVFSSSSPYFRYCLYIVFFILFSEFGIDVFISTLLSFRMRRLILVRPFSLKKFSLIKEYNITPSVKSVKITDKRFYMRSLKDINAYTLKRLVPVTEKSIQPDNFFKPFQIPQSREFYSRYLKSFVSYPPKSIYLGQQLRSVSVYPPREIVSRNYLKSFSVSFIPRQIKALVLAWRSVRLNRLSLLNVYNSRISDKEFLIKYPSFKRFSFAYVKDYITRVKNNLGLNPIKHYSKEELDYINAKLYRNRDFMSAWNDARYRKAKMAQREDFIRRWSDPKYVNAQKRASDSFVRRHYKAGSSSDDDED